MDVKNDNKKCNCIEIDEKNININRFYATRGVRMNLSDCQSESRWLRRDTGKIDWKIQCQNPYDGITFLSYA